VPTRKKRSTASSTKLITLRSEEMQEAHQAGAAIEEEGGQVLHMYGPRVMIAQVPASAERKVAAKKSVRSVSRETVARAPERLTEVEELGLEAWNLRQSPEFEEAKAERPKEGEQWDSPEISLPPDGHGMQHTGEDDVLGAPEHAAEDMSPYLIGSVAVGIIMVEGPRPELRFSAAERVKIAAETQEGLTWLAKQEPRASVTWAYDIRTVQVDVKPDPRKTGYEPLESHWRNPAMKKLGYSANMQGVRDYVATTRKNLGARWGYVAFFTKYPLHHFAYALKPRLVMHYDNDGWGPDNIDRVFTHETGHIFGCPDEYGSSQCSCTSRYGYLSEVNGNCERCASPFVPCLMAANTWAMCKYTKTHFGWRDSDNDGIFDPVDPLVNPTFDWRILLRRFPTLFESLGMQGLTLPAASAEQPAQESIPLFLLRRVLSDAEMKRVEEAQRQEEQQYLDAIAQKLSALARDVRAEAKISAEPPPPPPKPKRRR
jgi:hypothetical protein